MQLSRRRFHSIIIVAITPRDAHLRTRVCLELPKLITSYTSVNRASKKEESPSSSDVDKKVHKMYYSVFDVDPQASRPNRHIVTTSLDDLDL